jgi:hypothetical protein
MITTRLRERAGPNRRARVGGATVTVPAAAPAGDEIAASRTTTAASVPFVKQGAVELR